MKNMQCVLRIAVVLCMCANTGSAVELELAGGTFEIQGFVSQGFLKSGGNNINADTKDGTFQFNEFGINFGTYATDRLHVGMQLLSRDLGDIGNNNIEIHWAYGDYRWKDWLGIRAGQIKTPWGLYNETRDIDLLRTWVFLPGSLYKEDERDVYDSFIGVSAYGNVEIGDGGDFDYQLGYGEKHIPGDSSFFRGLDPFFRQYVSMTIRDIFAGSLEWNTPLDGLRLRGDLGRYTVTPKASLSAEEQENLGIVINFDPPETETYRIFSCEYARESVTLAAEYIADSGKLEAYYGSAAYWVTEWLEVGGYYSVSHDRERYQNMPDSHKYQKDFVMTTRINFNEYWTLKFEGHFIDGTHNILKEDNPDELKEHSWLFAVKTTYSF